MQATTQSNRSSKSSERHFAALQHTAAAVSCLVGNIKRFGRGRKHLSEEKPRCQQHAHIDRLWTGKRSGPQSALTKSQATTPKKKRESFAGSPNARHFSSRRSLYVSVCAWGLACVCVCICVPCTCTRAHHSPAEPKIKNRARSGADNPLDELFILE